MSMELHAFMPDAAPPSRAAWQAALTRLSLPLRLAAAFKVSGSGGFCPMNLAGMEAGVEIHFDHAADLADAYAILPAALRAAGLVVSFRWAGDQAEYACALGASAGLAEDFGATVFDPASGTTYDGSAGLARECANVLEQIKRSTQGRATTRQVVSAIARLPNCGWRYVVDRRIVCHSLDGNYLRGIHVDRTSSPGVFRIKLFQNAWFAMVRNTGLSFCSELPQWLSGDANSIAASVKAFLDENTFARDFVFTPGDAPFVPMPGGMQEFGYTLCYTHCCYAIMRALDGDEAAALPVLQNLRSQRIEASSADSLDALLEPLVSCIERGEPVRAVLDPLLAAAKARMHVQPIKPSKHATRPTA